MNTPVRLNASRLKAQFLCRTALSGLALVLLPMSPAAAIGAGDVNSAMNATAATAGSTTTVTLAPGASRAILDWKSFNVAAPETLKFIFNGKDGIAFNRVGGAGPGTARADIFGTMMGCVVACPGG